MIKIIKENGIYSIMESSESKKIEKFAKNLGADLILIDSNNIELSKIVVPKEARGTGIGSKIMKEIIKYADSVNKIVTLTPSKDFGGSVPKLIKFYKSFGFVENKGKNKDYEISDTMYRLPK